MDHFLPSHQNFTRNSARNSKIEALKNFSRKMTQIGSFQGLKIDFEIQWQYRIFWQVSRIQKSYPICRRQKVEVDSTPSALWYSIDLIYIVYLSQSLMFSHLSIRSILLIVVVLANWNFFDIKDSGDFKRNPRNPWNINQAEDFFLSLNSFTLWHFCFSLI